jgi:signal transduction histidine kinase
MNPCGELVRGVLLKTLERLLDLPAVDLGTALNHAAQLMAEALHADKVDAFLYDPAKDSLRAVGTSDTPLARHQKAIGLDFLQIANGGSLVEVWKTGQAQLTGHLEQRPDELPGLVRGLGIHSQMAVPLGVAGERRGVLCVSSKASDAFSEADLTFLSAAARWVGAVAHRAELVEEIAAASIDRGRRLAAEELVTVLAHDLHNHLTPLLGRLELLRTRAARESRPGDARDAEQALRSVGGLQRIITDLLDTARLEQGMFAVLPKATDLARLTRETAGVLGTPDVEVHVSGPDELLVVVDPARIRQALENVISNAVKHSPRGKAVLVDVRAEQQPGSPECAAVVEISDQGPGISPEILPHIFERFVTHAGSSGLGLGLYLASKIVEAHGGTLAASSAPGEGARFRMTLPAAAELEPPARRPPDRVPVLAEGPAHAGSCPM